VEVMRGSELQTGVFPYDRIIHGRWLIRAFQDFSRDFRWSIVVFKETVV
jgi:hypothetical protein